MLTVTPRYGRDYKTGKEAKAAWAENKDFTVADMFSPWAGKAVNKQDAESQGLSILIRFCKLTKTVKV